MTDKTKKTLSILLLIISILLLLVSLQVVIKDFSPQDQEASTIPKKTKKWNPGHYIQLGNTTSAGQINSVLSEPAASGIKGVRVSLYWEEIEPQQNVYSRAKIDEYLNALPPGKKIMLMMWERDYWGRTCSGTARLPKYIKNHPNNPALNFSGGCIAQTWKPDIQDRWVKALNKVAEYIDNDNRVEAIIFPESSFGIPEGYEGNVSKLRDEIESGLISIHTGIAPQYKKTHVFQNMNWIGGRTCV